MPLFWLPWLVEVAPAACVLRRETNPARDTAESAGWIACKEGTRTSVKLTVERLPESQLLLDIVADEKEVNDAMDRAYRTVSRQVRVPGFRLSTMRFHSLSRNCSSREPIGAASSSPATAVRPLKPAPPTAAPASPTSRSPPRAPATRKAGSSGTRTATGSRTPNGTASPPSTASARRSSSIARRG